MWESSPGSCLVCISIFKVKTILECIYYSSSKITPWTLEGRVIETGRFFGLVIRSTLLTALKRNMLQTDVMNLVSEVLAL